MYNFRGRRRRSPRTVRPDSENSSTEILDQDDSHKMDGSHSTEMSEKYEGLLFSDIMDAFLHFNNDHSI